MKRSTLKLLCGILAMLMLLAMVSCNTENLEKTIEALFSEPFGHGYPKSEAERKIKDSEQLKEIANLRVENMELGLKELGELVTPKLTKSGVNHRLKKIEELANKYKGSI